MNIKIDVSMPKELPKKQLDNYVDKTVYHVARNTLDLTAIHIPYLSGDMKRDIMAYGVKGRNKVYTLGFLSAKYTPYVWDYPQNTNWTNPNSYAQWFVTEYKKDKDKINRQAVNQAMKGLK